MKAMIFSAGMGKRFKPWTDNHPKALALVNGKSLLQHNIEYLQQYGIREVVVNIHHFGEQVITAIEKNKGWGSNIIICDERDKLLETGGGLLNARKYLEGPEPFLTLNADILTNLNLHKLIEFHLLQEPLISFGVTCRRTSRYFLFDERNRLCGWRNVQTNEERIVISKPDLIQKAYSCVAVFQPEFFSLVKQTGKFSLTETYLCLAAENLLLGFDHSGDKLVDVGKPESVELAEGLFK